VSDAVAGKRVSDPFEVTGIINSDRDCFDPAPRGAYEPELLTAITGVERSPARRAEPERLVEARGARDVRNADGDSTQSVKTHARRFIT
jgi:hypothetical protein